jgi:hypothetical protein
MQSSSTQWNASSYHSSSGRKIHSTKGDAPYPPEDIVALFEQLLLFRKSFTHFFGSTDLFTLGA